MHCASLFYLLDRAITGAGVRDGGARTIAGYPYLRMNRFLASFAREPMSDAAFDAWVERLQRLAETGWRLELANLPRAQRGKLQAYLPQRTELAGTGDGLEGTVGHCADLLRERDLRVPGRRQALVGRSQVSADYVPWQRALGLYPFAALPFARGVQRWQERTREVFARPVDALPVQGQLLRFVPPPQKKPLDNAAVALILQRTARNPLHIPEPEGKDREPLFAAFAPAWEVDVVTDDDRIGRPYWGKAAVPWVDVRRPTVYRQISHTRLNGKVLLQLNYVVWFPARPKRSALDLLGGHLDGITWRVTLAPEGLPLAYDTIHNCGCYHQFFPTARLQLKPQPHTLEEEAFIPQQAPPLRGSRPRGLTLRIASATHYLQRLRSEPSGAVRTEVYGFADYDALRSLPLPTGARRSLFRPDGIVPGTQRGERWLFWPMGVPEPGAMRQWGRHATAFVGQRHFDDPDLFERYFLWAD
jgi:hypothetical protein